VEWNAVWNVVQAVGTIVAIIVAVKAMKKDKTSALVLAIFADDKWEKTVAKIIEDAREAGRTAAADRVQVLINPRDYMPREVQDITNREIFRRLANVEQKIDDVPEATAEQVMLKLREQR
jgi:hypothetical protein